MHLRIASQRAGLPRTAPVMSEAPLRGIIEIGGVDAISSTPSSVALLTVAAGPEVSEICGNCAGDTVANA